RSEYTLARCSMTSLAFLYIHRLSAGRVSWPVKKFNIPDPRTRWFDILRHFITKPVNISSYCLHFPAIRIDRMTIQASFNAIIHSFINILDGSAAFAEPWIGRKYSTVVIAPGFCTGIQMTILAIHPIRDSSHFTLWSKEVGRICYQVSSITDQQTGFSQRDRGSI